MAPITRSKRPQTPPPQRLRGIQADTIKKSRFFQAWDERGSQETMHAICQAIGTTSPTGRRWLHERDQLGSKAYRRTRKLSHRLGRKSAVSDETCKMLVSPSRNPVSDQLYEAQIAYFHLPIKKRQLQTRLKQSTNGGQRYKQAYIQKEILDKNRRLRTNYSKEHKDKTVYDF